MKFNFFEWWNEVMTNKTNNFDISYPEEKKKNIRCALVIGHKKNSAGAYNNLYNMHEFDFNEHLAMDIEKGIKNYKNIDIFRVYRRTYSSLPNDINELSPDFIISLHCNAFNKSASGTEVLYYHKSKKGKQFATILNNHLVDKLKLPDRGIRAKSSEDRGGYLLKSTNAPCLIAEPFFIDNDNDYKIAGIDKYTKLVDAYCHAIEEISTII